MIFVPSCFYTSPVLASNEAPLASPTIKEQSLILNVCKGALQQWQVEFPIHGAPNYNCRLFGIQNSGTNLQLIP